MAIIVGAIITETGATETKRVNVCMHRQALSTHFTSKSDASKANVHIYVPTASDTAFDPSYEHTPPSRAVCLTSTDSGH